MVDERNSADAFAFIEDLCSRLKGRVQLTTDGLKLYLDVIDGLMRDRVDYATIHKMFGKDSKADETKYSPTKCNGIEKRAVMGDPDMSKVSTSYVERQNLTTPMGMRRFTGLTNAFSKKVENLAAAVALHFMHYNYTRLTRR